MVWEVFYLDHRHLLPLAVMVAACLVCLLLLTDKRKRCAAENADAGDADEAHIHADKQPEEGRLIGPSRSLFAKPCPPHARACSQRTTHVRTAGRRQSGHTPTAPIALRGMFRGSRPGTRGAGDGS